LCLMETIIETAIHFVAQATLVSSSMRDRVYGSITFCSSKVSFVPCTSA
jgi:hypothetical protein